MSANSLLPRCFGSTSTVEVGLRLVRTDYANAVLVNAGRPLEPSDILRKRPIFLERGFFRTQDASRLTLCTPAVKQLGADIRSLGTASLSSLCWSCPSGPSAGSAAGRGTLLEGVSSALSLVNACGRYTISGRIG